MMRLIAVAFALIAAGCAIPFRTLPVGAVTNVAAPIAATGEIGCSGEAHVSGKAYSIFGLVAWGDASIESARTDLLNNFRLSRLTTIDYRRRSLFGVTTYETVLCGFFVRNYVFEQTTQVAEARDISSTAFLSIAPAAISPRRMPHRLRTAPVEHRSREP
jgi:hypothetical protein